MFKILVKLLFNCWITSYVISRCFDAYSDKCYVFNEILILGKRGVTIGIRAGRSVRSIRESCRVLVIFILLSYVVVVATFVESRKWLEETMLR